jgi:hypothetical protein
VIRRAPLLAVASVAVVVLAGCSGSSGASSGGSSGGSSTTSTSTAPKRESAWVKQWQPVLTGAYATAQQAFLGAIQGGEAAEVLSAGQKVAVASAAFRQAVANAGPPPTTDASAAAKLVHGLETEGTIVAEVLRTCTAASDQCQAAVTAYGTNNSQQIVPALTALGVR